MLTRDSSSRLRDVVVTAAALSAVFCSFWYYGSNVNVGLLVLVVALVLTALTAIGWYSIALRLLDRDRALWSLLVALLWLVVVYVASPSAETSFPRTWAIALLPLGAALTLGASDRSIRWLAGGLAIVIAVLGAVSAARFLALGERAFRPLLDPNNYATLLYLVWIPLGHAYLSGAGERHGTAALARNLLWLTALGALILSMLATHSRSGQAIALVTFAIWGYLVVRKRLPARRFLALAVTAVVAVLVMQARAPSAIGVGGTEDVVGGVETRFDLLRAAWKIFLDHPVFGSGISTFQILYPVYRPLTEQETAGVFVHNDYAQLAAEGGVVMLLLALAFVAAVVVKVWQGLRASPGSAEFSGLGVALALGAACAHAFVNFIVYLTPLALMVGMSWGYLNRKVATAIPSGPAPRTRAIAPLFGLAFGWTAWAYLALDALTYGVFYNQSFPFAVEIRRDPARALAFAYTATRLNGRRGLPLLGAATILHRQALREADPGEKPREALALFRRAIEVDPWNPVGYLELARHVRAFPQLGPLLSRLETPEALLLKALSVDPVNVEAIDTLAETYAKSGEVARSITLFERVVLPRLPMVKRRNEAAANRYLSVLESIATARNDPAFTAEVERTKRVLERIEPLRIRTWI